MTTRPVHVVGGGVAGLVAAITAAEEGAPVFLHEAEGHLGGRAVGGTERSGVNLGPHVLFSDGAVVRWLSWHRIPVGLRMAPIRFPHVVDNRGVHVPVRASLELLPTLRGRTAPVEQNFRRWAEELFGEERAAVMCRLAGLFTFHHDPGSLSAAFVWDRYRRTIVRPDRVRWVTGGWTRLVDALVQRAVQLGVHIEMGQRLTPGEVPEGPVVMAVPLANASRLLERRLSWPGARTALLDVVARRDARWPALVADIRSDLSTCCMVERETAVERGLLDEDAELFQAQLGISPGVGASAGVARIEATLDAAVEGWRGRVLWRRGHVVADSTGALDPPGATWRDRPAVDQGDDRFLAGDAVAVPGMLSEVSVNGAVRAARLALEARRRRAFAPGWPSIALSPERRLSVLASVVPGATLSTQTVGADERRAYLEPVDETGPGYRLRRRRRSLAGLAVTGDGEGVRLTTLRVRRRGRPPPAA